MKPLNIVKWKGIIVFQEIEVFIIRRLIYLLLVTLLLIGCSSSNDNDASETNGALKSRTVEIKFTNADPEQHYLLSISNKGITSGDVASYPEAELRVVKGDQNIKLKTIIGDNYEIGINETTAKSTKEWILDKKNVKTSSLIKTVVIVPNETTDIIEITL